MHRKEGEKECNILATTAMIDGISIYNLLILFSTMLKDPKADVCLTVHRNSVWIRKTN